MQRVHAVALGERGALLDAEAVLLVDDDHAQAVELDARLEQRVRADDERGVARGDALQARAPLGRAQVARDHRHLDAERLDEPAHGRGVLLHEHLGGREQRGLCAALRGAQHRVHGDDRLARADVAEQQAPHRPAAREVAVDVADAALLAVRERERQRRVVALEQLAGAAEGLRLGRAGAALGERDLQQQQLLVGQAVARDARLLGRLRRVQRGDGVAAQRQAPRHAQGDGQRIGDRVRARQVLLDELAQHARRERARGVVDGHDAARVQPLPRLGEHLVLAHGQLEPAARRARSRASAGAAPAAACARGTPG